MGVYLEDTAIGSESEERKMTFWYESRYHLGTTYQSAQYPRNFSRGQSKCFMLHGRRPKLHVVSAYHSTPSDFSPSLNTKLKLSSAKDLLWRVDVVEPSLPTIRSVYRFIRQGYWQRTWSKPRYSCEKSIWFAGQDLWLCASNARMLLCQSRLVTSNLVCGSINQKIRIIHNLPKSKQHWLGS